MDSVLDFLKAMLPVLEPMLVDVETNKIQPELKSLIAGVTNPELQAFLTGVDAALDALVKTEIKKLG
jgi:hypothetical protein